MPLRPAVLTGATIRLSFLLTHPSSRSSVFSRITARRIFPRPAKRPPARPSDDHQHRSMSWPSPQRTPQDRNAFAAGTPGWDGNLLFPNWNWHPGSLFDISSVTFTCDHPRSGSWVRLAGPCLWLLQSLPDVSAGGVSNPHLGVQPAVNKFLQASLSTQMFDGGVVCQHVFPRVDFEQVARRCLRMRTVGLGPRQPPVVDASLLLSADIAVERLSPGQILTP